MPVLPKLMWKLQYLSDADFKEMNKPKTRGGQSVPGNTRTGEINEHRVGAAHGGSSEACAGAISSVETGA